MHIQNPYETTIQKNWLWQDCKLVLKRKNPNNLAEIIYENLQAEVDLESEDIQQAFQPTIQFEKQIPYDAKKGYYWKRRKELPLLIVKLQPQYWQQLKDNEQIVNIYCQLIVVYQIKRNFHHFLQEINSFGQKRKIFQQEKSGEVSFDKILIQQSSQRKSNIKFSILISICASSVQQNKIILKSLVSTQFFIQNKKIKRKNVCLMRLVSPQIFMKPFYNNSQFQNQLNQQQIINSLKLCNMNAKKISLKHPLYIGFHFENIFNFYLNSIEVQNIDQLFAITTQKSESQQQKKFRYQQQKKSESQQQKQMKSQQQKKSEFQKQKKQESQKLIQQNQINKFTVISYIVKKHKKIRKIAQKSITKLNFRINASIKKGKSYQNKLLLVTFDDNILNFIAMINQFDINQQNVSVFKKELDFQLKKFSEMFQTWSKKLFLKIDFLKSQNICSSWTKLNKNQIFQAYKAHYHQTAHTLCLINSNQQCNIKT